jgi:SAM-dependent methyltransferase
VTEPTPDDWAPTGIDVSVPSIARVYDALIGGKDNFAADRAVAEAMIEVAPGLPNGARAHRALLARGVRFLAEQGIDQFVDIGSGLPTVQNTHEVAQAVNPKAAVVYVDNDPIVLAHGRALLADNDRTTVVTADLREPDAVLDHPDLRALIDLDRPIALMLLSVVHHLGDDEDPDGLVRRYRDALPSGSYLFLSHFARTGPHSEQMEKVMLADLGTGRFRTEDELAAFFGDFELLEPGIVFDRAWRAEEELPDPLPVVNRMAMAGLARKP